MSHTAQGPGPTGSRWEVLKAVSVSRSSDPPTARCDAGSPETPLLALPRSRQFIHSGARRGQSQVHWESRGKIQLLRDLQPGKLVHPSFSIHTLTV